MRFKFFPGSELSPPQLLGGIVDLDRPQHLVANLFVDDNNEIGPYSDERLFSLREGEVPRHIE
nr:hypothetical protein [Acidobacteriota bacterium]